MSEADRNVSSDPASQAANQATQASQPTKPASQPTNQASQASDPVNAAIEPATHQPSDLANQPSQAANQASQPSAVWLKPNTCGVQLPLCITQAQVDAVIADIADLVGGRKPTPAMIIRIVAQCLNSTKRLKLTPSLEKKLIIHTIQVYISKVDGLTSDDVDLLMTVVDSTVDEAIDTLNQFKGQPCCVVC